MNTVGNLTNGNVRVNCEKDELMVKKRYTSILVGKKIRNPAPDEDFF